MKRAGSAGDTQEATGRGRHPRPLVGVTLGAPAGVRPEIILKALAEADVYEISRPLVIGDRGVLERAASSIGAKDLRLNTVRAPSEGQYECGTIDLLEAGQIDLRTLQWGQIQAEAGQAAFEFIRTAIDLALEGKIEAMATAPINKEALQVAGVP